MELKGFKAWCVLLIGVSCLLELVASQYLGYGGERSRDLSGYERKQLTVLLRKLDDAFDRAVQEVNRQNDKFNKRHTPGDHTKSNRVLNKFKRQLLKNTMTYLTQNLNPVHDAQTKKRNQFYGSNTGGWGADDQFFL